MKNRHDLRKKHLKREFLRPKNLGKPEALEPRLLLYAPTGGAWSHPELVSVSFMPDGTDVGGTPTSLGSTMNSRWNGPTWQKEMLRGIQNWAAVSNLNFTVVADDGSAFGSAGSTGTDNNLQGDRNFGDLRIGGFELGSYLGVGMLPPPINGDTTAGDFFLNTSASWNMGSSYDLLTVSTHEAGHVLGLDHSGASSAEMYSNYNGVKTNLSSDDIAGIQSIYGSRHKDSFDAAAPNDSKSNATVVTSAIDSNKQVSLSALDITTGSDVDFYKITIPSGAAGSMTIKMQATGLSLLAPKLTLYNSGGSQITSVTGTYGSTVQLSRSISAGQTYYIAADGADSSVFGIGSYALQINMGTAAQSAVASPNTAVAASGEGGNASGMSTGQPTLGGSLLSGSNSLLGGLLHPVGTLVETTVETLTGGLQLLTNLIGQGKAEADTFEHTHGDGDAHEQPADSVVPPGERHHDAASDNVDDTSGDRLKKNGVISGKSSFTLHAAAGYERGTGSQYPATETGPDRQTAAKVLDEVADTDPLDVRRPGFALVRELSTL